MAIGATNPLNPAEERATLGGGCFWCLDGVMQRLRGVQQVVSGYAGGRSANPDYRSVCSGDTGHAEVVQITYDPEQLSYQDLLKVFFAMHDPTTLNRQGADVGSQYRSVIFYHNDVQREQALLLIDELSQQAIWPDPIVTQVVALEAFYPAEDYHQNYYQQNPDNRYCQWVIEPKITKLLHRFGELVKG